MSQKKNQNKYKTFSGRSFYIENLGCSKNQVDAEVMIAALKNKGWHYEPENPEKADLIIVNTCGFIKSSQEESINTLLGARRDYPDKKIMAAGCLSQRWIDKLPELLPEIDGFFGNRVPALVTEIAPEVVEGSKPVFAPGTDKAAPAELPEGESAPGKTADSDFSVSVSESASEDLSARRKDFFGFNRSVYVKISDGCNHRCRFCTIPAIKGPLLSRPFEQVVNEVDNLLSDGVFELNFIAQDLVAYGYDRGEKKGSGLIKLIKTILDKPHSNENFWIRLLYLYPDDFPDGLPELMASDSRILPYFDLPFQHASAEVLKKMGRSGSYLKYMGLIEKIRTALPDAVIRSTFLTGHPGEGRREFEELLRFQEEAQLDWLGVFDWSREEDTPAARDKGALLTRLGAPAARRRKEILEERQQHITASRMEKWIGRELDVLIEEPVEGEDLAIGRAFLQAPEVDGSVVLDLDNAVSGDVIRAVVKRSTGFDLHASPLTGGR